MSILQTSGFGALVDVNNVHAVGANEYGQPIDIILRFDDGCGNRDVQLPIADGVNKLTILRQSLRDVFETCGNMHLSSRAPPRGATKRREHPHHGML